MNLPYQHATSGQRAIEETQRLLSGFGCQRFGSMTDAENGCLILQFTHRDRNVSATASFKGYATAWLKANPYTNRMKINRVEYERRALKQAEISVCSILRDWIKGQVMAVECGILSFEGAFLGQILLPSTGRTILEEVQSQKLLPSIEGPSE